MQQILIIFMILIIGCQSSQEKSFNNLTEAFINWYFKYHPVEAIRYISGNYHDNFKVADPGSLEEYLADISRFLIELSQIDETKLPGDDRIDYEMLETNLEKLKFSANNIRPWEWNPLWSINELYDGLFILSEGSYINMEHRVNAVQSRLEKLPSILDNSIKSLVFQSPLHVETAKKKSAKLRQLLKKIPLNLTSDNTQLDYIDVLIHKSISKLNAHEKWLDSGYKELEYFTFPYSLKLMDDAFHLFNGNKYIPTQVYHLAKKKLIPVQNRMFNLSLPLYLKNNDEPVWLDRNDTLEVIRWTLDDMSENTAPRADILSTYYESITRLENFTMNNNLTERNMYKPIRLEFTPDYYYQTVPAILFDYHPKDKKKEAVYYIHPQPEYLEYEEHLQLTEYEMDLYNISALVPGFGTQLAFAQSQPSMVRYLFPDPITQAGWVNYAVFMVLNAGFGNWEEEYHLLKLQGELKAVLSAIIEEEYYSGSISREDAIRDYHEQAFLSWSVAESAQIESELNYFSGTASFIGLMELKSLRGEFEKVKGEDFTLAEFHHLVLKNGVIPIHQIKKGIFAN